MDPYKILGVSRATSLENIKKNFRKLALELHPDRGGNEHMFNILKESYMHILQNIIKESKEKSFTELKEDHNAYLNEQHGIKNTKLDEESIKKHFHKVFEENKLATPYTKGYQKHMEKSDEWKEINIEKKIQKFTLDKFNKQFDDITPINSKHLVKKYNPEPFSLSKNLEFTELGNDKIKDFSGKNESDKGLQYTDYMKAHTTNKLNPSTSSKSVYKRQTLDDVKRQRASISYVMNESESHKHEKYKQKMREQERIRLLNIERQDKEMEKLFHKVNKSMLKYKS